MSTTILRDCSKNIPYFVADSVEATGLKWAAPASASGPAFRAYRSTSDQVTTEDTYTKLQFNAESFDTDSCFDSTTNYRFTPNKAGYYNFNVGLRFLTNDLTEVRIYKNGSAAAQIYAQTVAANITANGSALLYANGTTDYFEVFAYLASATSRNLDDGEVLSFFDGVWIRS